MTIANNARLTLPGIRRHAATRPDRDQRTKGGAPARGRGRHRTSNPRGGRAAFS